MLEVKESSTTGSESKGVSGVSKSAEPETSERNHVDSSRSSSKSQSNASSPSGSKKDDVIVSKASSPSGSKKDDVIVSNGPSVFEAGKNGSEQVSRVANDNDDCDQTPMSESTNVSKCPEYVRLKELGFSNDVIIQRLCKLFNSEMVLSDPKTPSERKSDMTPKASPSKSAPEKAPLSEKAPPSEKAALSEKVSSGEKSGKVSLSDLDSRAIDALKDYTKTGKDTETLLAILDEFESNDLEHVTNKSAFLCGLMKNHRQKGKGLIPSPLSSTITCTPSSTLTSSITGKKAKTHSVSGDANLNSLNGSTSIHTHAPTHVHHPGPDPEKLKEILERTNYSLDVTSGQRKYGGPPPQVVPKDGASKDDVSKDGASKDDASKDDVSKDGVAEGKDESIDHETETLGVIPPAPGCEVFVGKIPKEIFEDKLIPLFESIGRIWDLRLMIDPLTGYNRGYAFITYCNKEDASSAQEKFDGYEIEEGKKLKVNISVPNLRLFVGNIPKSKSREDILSEFSKITAGLSEVIVYSSPDDRKKNRGFCFLEYESHKAASLAKRKLTSGRSTKVWGCDILVDWADPQEEPDEDTMDKVKVLYVRNLTADVTEGEIKDLFIKAALGASASNSQDNESTEAKNPAAGDEKSEVRVQESADKDSKPEEAKVDVKTDGGKNETETEDTKNETETNSAKNETETEDTKNETKTEDARSGSKTEEEGSIVERVKKIKDYAFVHFESREDAVRAMEALDSYEFHGVKISVSLAKPPSDKKKKEEILRARERRVNQMMQARHGDILGHPVGSLIPPGLMPPGLAHLTPHLGQIHHHPHLTLPHLSPHLAPTLSHHLPPPPPLMTIAQSVHPHPNLGHQSSRPNNAQRRSNSTSSTVSGSSSAPTHNHHRNHHNSNSNPYNPYGSPYLDWYSYYSQAGLALTAAAAAASGSTVPTSNTAPWWPTSGPSDQHRIQHQATHHLTTTSASTPFTIRPTGAHAHHIHHPNAHQHVPPPGGIYHHHQTAVIPSHLQAPPPPPTHLPVQHTYAVNPTPSGRQRTLWTPNGTNNVPTVNVPNGAPSSGGKNWNRKNKGSQNNSNNNNNHR